MSTTIPRYASLLFLFYNILHLSTGTLDLYLSTEEVQKLLGLDAELFYVRQGIVNKYALNFVIPMSSKMNTLNMVWQSVSDQQLPYSIDVEISNPVALEVPKLNITNSGYVPNTKTTFSITVPCTQTVDAEIDITIFVNITLTSNLALKLRRKKICTKAENTTNTNSINLSPNRRNSAYIFYYAVISAVILAATIIVCVVGLHIRNNKQRRSTEEPTTTQSFPSFLPPGLRNHPVSSSYNSLRREPSYTLIEDRLTPKGLQERISELTIQRCRVCLKTVTLEGTFGRIYQGTYTNEIGTEQEVLVKTVTDHASQTQISLLLQEGMSMYMLNHPNILTILRVSLEDNTAPFLLYPFHNFTNLKVFLQKCKICSEGVAHILTTQEVVDMALQIIEAMIYMHKQHILHKDLATRNCVVDSRLKVKITDNALSRDLFSSDYHCLGDNENRPIKWLALESLINKTFLTRSDVWSFGVLLWELTTLAQQPYVEIDPFEMAAYLKDGYRLAQPINCPDELFAVMAYCWAMHPENRPTFSQLQVCLKEFYIQLTRYV